LVDHLCFVFQIFFVAIHDQDVIVVAPGLGLKTTLAVLEESFNDGLEDSRSKIPPKTHVLPHVGLASVVKGEPF
jgi:hypothetical protein